MIAKIRNWAKQSEQNSLAFTAYSIIIVSLLWFIPYFVICIYPYGWNRVPESYPFVFIIATFLSMWIGFKFSMKFLYGKK
jgi:hypothetical protein